MSTADYQVVLGTIAALPAFQTAVNARAADGYTHLGSPTVDGGNIYQSMIKYLPGSIIAKSTITGLVLGSNGSFIVAGDQALNFPAGFRFTVTGSVGNSGVYTVAPRGSKFTTSTTIHVVELVASATVDGIILHTA